MLDAVTKKYVDASTEEQYSFSFFCDCCGRVVSTTKLAFHSGFEKKLFLFRAEQRARELVWQRDHESAYERANIEALKKLNRCVVCGAAICSDCTVECDEVDGKPYASDAQRNITTGGSSGTGMTKPYGSISVRKKKE